MTISVFIPYYGASDENMRRHFEAIASNSWLPSEIIVVNDGHKNDISLLLREMVQRHKIPVAYVKIHEDVPWNYQTVNLAVWLCETKYLSIEDCDFLPDEMYYHKGMETMYQGYDKFIAHYKNEDSMPAACGIYRKRMIAELGGWEEDFSGHYGFVDIWISALIDRNGFKVFRSDEKLIEKWNDGESLGVTRDDTRNREMLVSRLQGSSSNPSILRHKFTVVNFKVE